MVMSKPILAEIMEIKMVFFTPSFFQCNYNFNCFIVYWGVTLPVPPLRCGGIYGMFY